MQRTGFGVPGTQHPAPRALQSRGSRVFSCSESTTTHKTCTSHIINALGRLAGREPFEYIQGRNRKYILYYPVLACNKTWFLATCLFCIWLQCGYPAGVRPNSNNVHIHIFRLASDKRMNMCSQKLCRKCLSIRIICRPRIIVSNAHSKCCALSLNYHVDGAGTLLRRQCLNKRLIVYLWVWLAIMRMRRQVLLIQWKWTMMMEAGDKNNVFGAW